MHKLWCTVIARVIIRTCKIFWCDSSAWGCLSVSLLTVWLYNMRDIKKGDTDGSYSNIIPYINNKIVIILVDGLNDLMSCLGFFFQGVKPACKVWWQSINKFLKIRDYKYIKYMKNVNYFIHISVKIYCINFSPCPKQCTRYSSKTKVLTRLSMETCAA